MSMPEIKKPSAVEGPTLDACCANPRNNSVEDRQERWKDADAAR